MADLSIFFYFFVSASLAFIGVVCKALSLKKENNLLAIQLTETTIALEKTRQALDKFQEKHEKIGEFQISLGEAELTAKLQQTRHNSIPTPERSHNTPERYSYIHSLAEKGLSVEEIASILTISHHEARQLVTLAKIAQGN
jgi:hypothetical protein